MINKCVLHLRSSGGLLGAENVIIEVAKFSSLYGYTSIIGAINSVNDPYPDFLNLASEYHINTRIFETRGQVDLQTAKNIKKFVQENNIDIIHAHGYKENFYALLSRTELPKVATNHLWKGVSFKSRFYCALDTMLIRQFDKIVGVSDEIINHMDKLGIKKTFKIANGIDTDRFLGVSKNINLMVKYNISNDDFILGMISSLSFEKNHQIAINAMKKIDQDNIKLMIVGDGSLRVDLEDKVNSLGLRNKIIFTGSQSNVVDYFSLVDIFLLPSLTEGLPMALLEAMSSGKAVIASGVGDVPNVVDHGYNGYIIKPHDTEHLVQYIQKLYGDRLLLKNFGANAREKVVNEFSSKRMAQEYCRLYDDLI